MEWIAYVLAVLFVLIGGVCLVLVLLSLPGTWAMLATALVIQLISVWLLDGPGRLQFEWTVLGIALILALIGEIIEFFSGVIGAKYGGGTRRGMVGAIVGGVVGFVAVTPMLPFLPIIGSLIGAVIGTFFGAMAGEMSGPEGQLGRSVRPAIGATFGRLLGSVGKAAVATVAWIVLSVDAFLLPPATP